MARTYQQAISGVVAALFAAVALGQECPRTDACLSWKPPTHYTDGSEVTEGTVIQYRIYRNGELVSTPVIEGVAGQDMAFVLRNEPLGLNQYQATAIIDSLESAKSNSAEKMFRAPAPTDGAIEAPTDGSIEDL